MDTEGIVDQAAVDSASAVDLETEDLSAATEAVMVTNAVGALAEVGIAAAALEEA